MTVNISHTADIQAFFDKSPGWTMPKATRVSRRSSAACCRTLHA